VFGKPLDYGELSSQKGSPRVYRAIAEQTLSVIAELGREERALRLQSSS